MCVPGVVDEIFIATMNNRKRAYLWMKFYVFLFPSLKWNKYFTTPGFSFYSSYAVQWIFLFLCFLFLGGNWFLFFACSFFLYSFQNWIKKTKKKCYICDIIVSIPAFHLCTFDLFFFFLLYPSIQEVISCAKQKKNKSRSKSLFYYVPGQQYFIHSRLKRGGCWKIGHNIYKKGGFCVWGKGFGKSILKKTFHSIFYNFFLIHLLHYR